MPHAYRIGRTLFLLLLGLLGGGLVLAGLWFAWQGVPIKVIWMPLGAGGILAGGAWWLLFHEPPPVPVAAKPNVDPPAPVQPAPELDPGPIRIPRRYQRFTDDRGPRLVSADALRAALVGIGRKRLAGASWQEAAEDAQWADCAVFLHCERDKLGSSADDVDGLYLTRAEAEAAASSSPQANNSYVWKVFVAAVALRDVVHDRKALPHLARAIKIELAALPPGELPGTAVNLRSIFRDQNAWLDASGQRVVLFEDESGVLDGRMFSDEPETGAFKTDTGVGLFDAAGIVLLPPTFEDIEPIREGLAAAKRQGLWGFVDRTGRWCIEPSFAEVRHFFEDDYTCARGSGGWGIIDRQGQWKVPDRYAEIGKIQWIRLPATGVEGQAPGDEGARRRIAAVRQEAGGSWGGVDIDSRHDAQRRYERKCVCATEDEVFEQIRAGR